MQASEYATGWRVVANTALGRLIPGSLDGHNSREDAETELRDVQRRQSESPFPSMGAYIERRVDGRWERDA